MMGDPGSETIAFRMELRPGQAALYKARHDAIWPELAALLRQVGISDYRIFLHEASNSLFATLRRSADHGMQRLPEHALMQSWWTHMSDIMQTNPDGSPASETLPLMFCLD